MRRLLACLALAACAAAQAEPQPRAWAAVQAQKAPLLRTLETLVNIESGSNDREGLERMAAHAAAALRALGATVESVEAPEADIVRLEGTPPRPNPVVVATFRGKGRGSVLLLAHMDTVYERGALARQPFRIEGDRAYGLGISDDKQGVALVLHAMAALQALGFDDFGRITVLLNGDEEIGSPASRSLITRLAAQHDASLSFEASSPANEQVSLVTSGLAQAKLRVHGQSAHAANFGANRGTNALYELAHQINQLRELSDFPNGLRVTWTMAKSGTVPNRIPDQAEAVADIRVLRMEQVDAVEAAMRRIAARQLLPEAKVELAIERGRPPLEARPASRALALHARAINAELGRKLRVNDDAPQGGTDAAYAGLGTKGAVLEHWGVHGAGAHSGNAEYILVSSIEPRLYLTVRTLMDVGAGRVNLQGP